jgi:hypothetical protein
VTAAGFACDLRRAGVLPSGLVMSLFGAAGATPSSSWVGQLAADGTLFGSATISDPVRVSITDSSTPGSVGCRRSSIEKMPSSARSS